MYNSILSLFVFGFMASSKGDHTHIVLQMLKESGFEVFDLWNLRYIYCGSAGNTDLFRHDYIDHFDPACVSHLSVIYEGKDKLHLRYNNPASNVLEDILRRKPDYGSPRTPHSTDNYMINTNNKYEFLWLNNLNSTIYAGIYHSSEISKAPAFVYNVNTNSLYTENGNPTDFNDINSANDLHIELSIKDSCSFTAASTKRGSCPGKSKPVIYTPQTTVDVLQGSSVTLDCSYTAYGLATSVEWEFIAASSGITNTITQTTNNYKYSGATVYIPSLTISNFASTDVGQYKCTATNDKGQGEGSNIQLLIILASTLPPTTTETTLVTSDSQSTTQEPTSTIDNNLDSTTVSSTPQTTDATLVTTESQSTTQGPTSTFHNDLDSTTVAIIPETTGTTLVTSESQSTTQESTSTFHNDLDSTTVHDTTALSVMNSEFSTSGDSDWTTRYSSVSSTGTDTEKCPCSCEYKLNLEYWLRQNGTNYTIDELRIILEPRLSSITKDLKIDKKSLASFKNTLNSAPDDRSSSKSIGIVGITVLVSIFVIIVAMDMISPAKQCQTLRRTS